MLHVNQAAAGAEKKDRDAHFRAGDLVELEPLQIEFVSGRNAPGKAQVTVPFAITVIGINDGECVVSARPGLYHLAELRRGTAAIPAGGRSRGGIEILTFFEGRIRPEISRKQIRLGGVCEEGTNYQ
jgi:hypothetical protein